MSTLSLADPQNRWLLEEKIGTLVPLHASQIHPVGRPTRSRSALSRELPDRFRTCAVVSFFLTSFVFLLEYVILSVVALVISTLY